MTTDAGSVNQGSRATCGGGQVGREAVREAEADRAERLGRRPAGRRPLGRGGRGGVARTEGVRIGRLSTPAAVRAITGSSRPFSSAPRRAQGSADLRLRYLRYQTWAHEWRRAEGGRRSC